MIIHSNDKIDKIFKATFELIAKYGIHNTPMSAISKKACVAAGTIYHHFDSKDTLINALYLSLKKDLIVTVMQGYDDRKPFQTSFSRVWLNYYSYLVANPDILSFIEQCSNTPIITEETKKKAEKITKPLADFLNMGIKMEIFKIKNLYLIISLIHGAVVSLAKLEISYQITVTEDIKSSVVDYSWKGLT